MSMSEYENQKHQNHNESDNLSLSAIEPTLPDDFSEEDIDFAQELSTLFSAQDEVLPPYYAQTLLQAEDPRYTVVDQAFAQKTRARVFRALKLRRRLFSRRSPFATIGETLRDITTRKSLLAWTAALMLIMMLTAAFTAPSFEQGMTMLLRGSRSGIMNVKAPPPAKSIHHHGSDLMFNFRSWNTHPTQVPLTSVGSMLSFSLYWPTWMPKNYTLDNIKIYEDPNNTWANGPVVDLVYDLDTSHAALIGTGQIVIREFNPVVQVLQVVRDGFAVPIDADQYGDNPRAIYVNGQWMPTGKTLLPAWRAGGRSELIYQQSNVVFWIAGDQRDGITQKVLWKLGQSLQTTSTTASTPQKSIMATILLPNNVDTVFDPFANDIFYTVSLDGSNGQYYMTMTAYAYISGKLGASSNLSGH